MKTVRGYYKWNAGFSFIMGVLVAAFMLFLGFKHNNQGEFYNSVSGEVDYLYSFLIMFSWLIPVAVLSFAFGCIWIALIKKHGKHC